MPRGGGETRVEPDELAASVAEGGDEIVSESGNGGADRSRKGR
jgi:hypothetical protein